MAVRAARFIRASSQKQKDADTPATQRFALDPLLVRRNAMLVEEIVEIVSGGADAAERPGLQKLLRLIRGKLIDEVHVYKIDRLTRHDDPSERFMLFSACAEANVLIVEADGTVTDPCDPSGMGEIGYYLKTWAAAGVRRRIKTQAADAFKRLRAEGKSTGRKPHATSFDKASRKWSYTEQIDKVKDAYRRFDAGGSFGVLAASRLLGVTQRGARCVLSHPIYRGITEGGVRVFTADEQAIPDDLWLRVQSRLNGNHDVWKKVRERAAPHWASALIVSAHATTEIARHKLLGTHRTGDLTRFRCMCTFKKFGIEPRCQIGYLPVDRVQGWIDEALSAVTSDPDVIAHVQKPQESDTETERTELERQIKNAEAAMKLSCRNNEIGGKPDKDHLRDIAGYMNLRDIAQERLDAMTAVKPLDEAAVVTWLEGFTWSRDWTPQIKRDWVRRYCSGVAIARDGVARITLRLPDGSHHLLMQVGGRVMWTGSTRAA